MGEWLQRNLDQPPLVIIRRGGEDSDDDGRADPKPSADVQDIQRVLEDQTRLMTTLQKQLAEQNAIIRNQAAFIADLQRRDKEQSHISEAICRIQDDVVSIKSRLNQQAVPDC